MSAPPPPPTHQTHHLPSTTTTSHTPLSTPPDPIPTTPHHSRCLPVVFAARPSVVISEKMPQNAQLVLVSSLIGVDARNVWRKRNARAWLQASLQRPSPRNRMRRASRWTCRSNNLRVTWLLCRWSRVSRTLAHSKTSSCEKLGTEHRQSLPSVTQVRAVENVRRTHADTDGQNASFHQ